MGPKTLKEQPADADTTKNEFVTKLSTAAEAMRQFGNFADALAKVVAKVPLDDAEVVEALQIAIDAIPSPSRKRKFTALGGVDEGKRRKREKKPKDPNAPKAPPSAYILFQNDIRNAVREANPNIQYRELMGLISQQWNSLPQEKKQPYFDRVAAAKQTHEEEMAKYNALNSNHVPSLALGPSGGTSKMPKKEVEPAEKPEKKVASKPMKITPKAAEPVASPYSEATSGEESAGEEKDEADKASEDGSSEEEESYEEPTPPPAKKAKRADKPGRK